MKKFTLLHDGSAQGWQATYLAFHVAAQLGSPLQVLLIDSNTAEETLEQQVAYIETGGRAASVAVEIRLLADFSLDSIKENAAAMDGLFVPQRLIPDGETAVGFLDALSCPLWITSKEPEIREMAVLINDPIKDEKLISYTKNLSHRFQQPLKALIEISSNNLRYKSETSSLAWIELPTLSLDDVTLALKDINVGLLFISASNAFMADKLPCNFIICPDMQNA